MTSREFFEGIVNAGKVEGTPVTAEFVAYAEAKIAELDKRNEKRKTTPSKTAIANEPIKAQITEYLKARPGVAVPAVTLATEVGITTQKASALARQLVEAGTLVAAEEKIKGKGKVKVYAFAGDIECELDTDAAEPEA